MKSEKRLLSTALNAWHDVALKRYHRRARKSNADWRHATVLAAYDQFISPSAYLYSSTSVWNYRAYLNGYY